MRNRLLFMLAAVALTSFLVVMWLGNACSEKLMDLNGKTFTAIATGNTALAKSLSIQSEPLVRAVSLYEFLYLACFVILGVILLQIRRTYMPVNETGH